MQINSVKHVQIVQNFKDRIMDSVVKKELEEDTFETILQDIFGQDKVEVFYDDEYLNQFHLDAAYECDSKNNFILKTDSFDCIRNKNLKEIKKGGFLEKFANFYENITHELSHGVYEQQNKEKTDFLVRNLLKLLKNPEDEKRVMEANFSLSQKMISDYETPKQVSRAVDYRARIFAPGDKNFTKFLHLNLLDNVQDESIAYLEGFKAKRDILGENVRFLEANLSFDDAKALIDEALYIARKAYFDKFVPVKNLNRYVMR